MLNEQLASNSTEDTSATDSTETEWASPSIDEQSACAEICAYVFQQ